MKPQNLTFTLFRNAVCVLATLPRIVSRPLPLPLQALRWIIATISLLVSLMPLSAASTVEVTFHGEASVNGGFGCRLDGSEALGFCYDPIQPPNTCYNYCSTESKTVTLEVGHTYAGSVYPTSTGCIMSRVARVSAGSGCYTLNVSGVDSDGGFTVTVNTNSAALNISPGSIPANGKSTAYASMEGAFTSPVSFAFVGPPSYPGLGCRLEVVDADAGLALITAGKTNGTV